MHTAQQLRPELLDVEIAGRPAGLDDLLPAWGSHDRFGIVVHEPFGSLGAGLLIQAATLCFYECRPSRRDAEAQYPEIHLFHVGGRHGDHSNFDFWPPRKEVEVDAPGHAVLAAINDRGITRLAVPDGAPDPGGVESDAPSSWADRNSALARLATCWAYAPDGAARDADVRVSTASAALLENAEATLDPGGTLAGYRGLDDRGLLDAAPGPTTVADMRRWLARVAAREHEVPDAARTRARERFRARVDGGGGLQERYRRCSAEQALDLLGLASS